MSVIKTTAGQHPLETRKCPNCQAVLPLQAQFCGACGRRVSRESREGQSANSSSPRVENDINERYRITSLIRRRPYVQLLLATDLRYQRPVVIRDIDISGLHKQTQVVARQAIEEEYNQLRRQRIQDVMLLVDLCFFQGHIYTIAECPFTLMPREKHERPLYTLDDLLQSGIGLPNETEAALWIGRLAQAITHLHHQHIILGDLDPYAIIVSSDTYEGMPALMVSWLPQAVRNLSPPPPTKTYTSSFYAPETYKGDIREQSDIYSLGAILYLMLTGTAPIIKTQAKKHVLRSPHELRSTVSSGIDEIVMHALANEPSDRFESMQQFAEALGDLITTPPQQSTHPLISTVFKGKRDTLELPAVRPSKPVSPYITRVLQAIPPVLPQTPSPVSSSEPVAPFAESGTDAANQTAQPSTSATPDDVDDVSIERTDQSKPLQAIEDIETIIINASEFEAALAQASHHLLDVEDEELYTRLANEAPEAEPVDAGMRNHREVPSVRSVETDSDVPVQEAPSELNEELQRASASDHATINMKMIEEQTTMTLEKEIQAHVEMKRSGAQETSLADIPTVSFKGPDLTILEVASKPQEELEVISTTEEDEIMAQPTSRLSVEEEHKPVELVASSASIEKEHKPVESVASPASIEEIEEAETQVAPIEIEEAETQVASIEIENAPTQRLTDARPLSVPADLATDEPAAEHVSAPVASAVEAVEAVESEQKAPIQTEPEQRPDHSADKEKPLGEQIKRFFTSPIPIIPRLLQNRTPAGNAPAEEQMALNRANAEKMLKRLRHFVLGQQQHNTSAAALIETPLRIQPDQNYTIRIQIMGRDAPRQAGVGLSGLAQNESIHIEVRSALYHKYAYIVQQADIRLPGHGFAAAVTIPMKPLSDGPSGRRERLHVYFMDEQRNPLYEKPFAIEIFISPLVQPGREGHNVLPIPL